MINYPSGPRPWATMWWDMHGKHQVLMKVKVLAQRPDGKWEVAKWNFPDNKHIADERDLSYTRSSP